MIAPCLFSFGKQVEQSFAGVDVRVSEQVGNGRKRPPVIPAPSETMEYVSAVETTRGVLAPLDPARLLRMYIDNTAHPARANAIM
eukprot:13614429-Alexandrium_andersonii.AAC.1